MRQMNLYPALSVADMVLQDIERKKQKAIKKLEAKIKQEEKVLAKIKRKECLELARIQKEEAKEQAKIEKVESRTAYELRAKKCQEEFQQQESIKAYKKLKKKRWVRFSNHAYQRYKERLLPYGFTLEDIYKDIFNWRQKVKPAWDGTYEVRWNRADYVLAKAKLSYDWLVITVYVSKYRTERYNELYLQTPYHVFG